ncbi:hypothetical protein RBS60_13025 [Sinomonas sp. ASV486]|uniref:Uncharacterized protein n=1 Tax=Sinomonas puerhi TaxID=3238584 RepID=A0AB39L1E0_9MICC|nr:hypothetical protein [Sinomonas sp. ASV486]MDQ4491119.1 hypothetical protein [Sinomonas sp. ASV486]
MDQDSQQMLFVVMIRKPGDDFAPLDQILRAKDVEEGRTIAAGRVRRHLLTHPDLTLDGAELRGATSGTVYASWDPRADSPS